MYVNEFSFSDTMCKGQLVGVGTMRWKQGYDPTKIYLGVSIPIVKPILVENIPDGYLLIQNSQDIKATLEGSGINPDLVGCVFVAVNDSYDEDWYLVRQCVPFLSALAYTPMQFRVMFCD